VRGTAAQPAASSRLQAIALGHACGSRGAYLLIRWWPLELPAAAAHGRHARAGVWCAPRAPALLFMAAFPSAGGLAAGGAGPEGPPPDAPWVARVGPRARLLMRRPRSSAAMAPCGPSHRRAVRVSRATCRRGAPLGVSFGAPATTCSPANPGKPLMLS